MGAAYAYELRRGEEIFSTGRLSVERELSPGDEVTVAGVVAHVEELSWGDGEPRIILRGTGQLAEIARGSRAVVDQNLTQRAFTTILEYFVAKGRAPHYAELADALDIDSEEAREVQRAAVEAAPIASCWLAHDTDYIESWAPFSNVPTHYLISVDGIRKWYGQ